jgi:hypothetical protein
MPQTVLGRAPNHRLSSKFDYTLIDNGPPYLHHARDERPVASRKALVTSANIDAARVDQRSGGLPTVIKNDPRPRSGEPFVKTPPPRPQPALRGPKQGSSGLEAAADQAIAACGGEPSRRAGDPSHKDLIGDGGGRNIVTRADKSEQARSAQQQSRWRRGEPSSSKTVPPTARCTIAPATRWYIAGGIHLSFFNNNLSLSARSTPNRRHPRLFSKDVPKIATRHRIYHCGGEFVGLWCVTALCFTQIVGNVFLQFNQARLIRNWRCQSKPFARTCGFF